MNNKAKLYCVRLPRRDADGNPLYLSGVERAAKRSTFADAQLLAERFGGEVVEVGGMAR